MTVVTAGIVLSRRPYGESDQLAVLFTEELGRVQTRFIGVRKSRGKLKALAEPMVHGEYRLYLRPGSPWATATGGQIQDSHPGLRMDMARTWSGLRACELVQRLTPEHQPSRDKFRLLAEVLSVMAAEDSPWLPVAFALRLLALVGFGMSRVRVDARDQALWARLHEEPMETIPAIPVAQDQYRRIEDFIERALEHHIEGPMRTTLFKRSLEKFDARVPPRSSATPAAVPAS